MKAKKVILVSALVSMFSVGCGEFRAAQATLEDVNAGKFDKSESRPACEIQEVEYQLDTKMVGFEMTGGGGLRAGFNLLTGFLNLINLDFQAKSGEMTLGMMLTNPMTPQQELVNVIGRGRYWSLGAGLDLGFNNINAGLNFYHQTPLAKLAEKSLNDTLTNLTESLQPLQDDWSTQVVAVPSVDDVIIPVGSFAGLQKGDTFAIYNVEHTWEGTPCQSRFLMTRKTPLEPMAYAELVDLAKNAAVLRLLNDERYPRKRDMRILKGSKVEVVQLVGGKRQLYRSLQIRSVEGAELSYVNGQKVDLNAKVRDQINALARSYGFMIYAP